ncbi:unnamed protein product [Urochloa humidicola]
MDNGYLEAEVCTSDSEGESAEGSYHWNADENTDCEDFLGLSGTNTEKELKQNDWEIFYSIGDIVKLGENSGPVQGNQACGHDQRVSNTEGTADIIARSEENNIVG